jgi:hypothetical protein
VLEHSGHFPQLDEPECFLEILLDFIEETGAAALRGGEHALPAAG